MYNTVTGETWELHDILTHMHTGSGAMSVRRTFFFLCVLYSAGGHLISARLRKRNVNRRTINEQRSTRL